ncbi:MAG: arginine--tRNA ligase, partial [bacterium]|nr:arginine--tRNA ligase [bacterium]
MFLQLEKRIQEALSAHLAERHGITDVAVAIEQPRESSFGELATPVAFQLARKLRKAPKQIAQDLVTEMTGVEGIGGLEVAGNGYI